MYKELLSLQNYIGIAAPSTAVRRRLQTSMQTGRSRQYFHVVHCRMAYCTVAVLFMVALWNRADHYIFILWFLSLLSSFFPRLISAWQIGCLPYLHTWCGLSANLECRSESCCPRLAGNTGRKKSLFWHHRTTLSGYIFGTKACIDNRKKIFKQQYLLHMSR